MRLRSQQVGLNAEGGGSPFSPGKRTAGRVAVFLGACGVWLAVTASLFAANVPAGFTETVVPGPGGGGAWNGAGGVTFSEAGRMFVWELAGRIWFKDPADAGFTQLLDISDEVASWSDHGFTGFALDPDFEANGNIYLLYPVDRHHLMNFGTTNYNPNANEYTQASIGRVTRYTCNASNNFTTVNPASRFILLGESKTNGIPHLSDTHGVGSLVFGQDHTLLVSCGDGASAWIVDTGGGVNGSFAVQGLADGIIKAKENVGGYRSQLVDCLDGKILRIDPVTGDGVPGNPFYDASKPRSAKSRVWTVGTRNPFRMSLRPESGSHDAADAKPGTLYIGNVGWDNWESLKVVTGPGQNLGWPLFEGLELTPTFIAGGTYNVDVSNLDAPNPLYPGGGCSQYFSFRQLLKQDSIASADQPPFNNPCNAGQKISTNIPQFLHRRPVLDWSHSSATTRTGTYNGSGQATTANIGAGGSPVTGTAFTGNCAVGGTWYVATNVNAFPTQYQNRYYMADWGPGFIKTVTFTTNDLPVAVNDFATGAGAVVCIAAHPTDGSIYYVSYNYGDAGTVRKISYTGNRTPVAVATSDKTFGPGPLTVQFTGSGSSDPDAQALTYSWNFGDGTAASTAVNPSHVFTPANTNAAPYNVTLTVTDTGSLSANASLLIVANDTPPVVTINNPTNGALYSMVTNTTFNLTAVVTDAESGDAQLAYTWETILHHNSHNHLIASSTNHASSTVVEPIGCDGVNILYYRIVLTVTDPAGLKTTREVGVFPNCGSTDTPPTISDITNQSVALGVATAALPFTLGDAQVAAANLQLSAGSSNLTLVPLNNIVFGGNGANRTVTVTPSAGINGTSLITVTVNDGPNNVSDTFLLTVTGSNSPPTISALADQSTGDGTPTAPNAFTIADVNTPAGNLALSGFAANTNLVPTANISFGGSGSNRTVTVTPAPGQLGSTLVTVVVSDGQLTASNSYTLAVTALTAATKSFTNSAAITIPDSGAASPYPSTINVTGLGGTITNVTVTLGNFNQTWGSDVDVLLVGPSGAAMMVMSDCGTGPANNVTLTISDGAATALPGSGLVSGTFKPTNFSDSSPDGDNFPGPAPAGPYGANFSTFDDLGANGVWSLYVFDDGPGDSGNFAGGWSITITTVASAGSQPPTISNISDQTTPTSTPTAALPFTIGDSDTAVSNLVLSASSSNLPLVPTNNIVFGGSGSNRTVTITPTTGLTGTATIGITVSDGTNSATDSFVLTVGTVTVTSRAFTNAAFITIPDSGAASPYPSTISVSGLSGNISNVTLVLQGFNQTWGSDVDVLLVSPSGQVMVPMSDCGDGNVNNVTLTLSDAAAASISASGLTSGTYKPTNRTDASPGGDNFPSPAPAGPYGSAFATFSNTAPNGTWSLYVYDDGPGDSGSFANGWILNITTTASGGASNTAPTITAITNQITTVNTPETGIAFTIGDAETAASNLVLTATSANLTLVPSNNIVFGGSGANRTVTLTPASNQLGTATVTLIVSDGTLSASNSFVQTVNPASLVVTENSASRSYGATNPVLAGSVTGLQAGDVITASFTTTAATNSPVGAYAIAVTLSDPGSKLGNYIVTTNNGTLTVTNAPLTVTENSASRIYGATNPVLSGSVVGLLAGDVITATFTTTAISNSPVGAYPIAFTLSDPGNKLGNYTVTTNNGTLTVTPVALLVKANNTNKVYRVLLTFTGKEFTLLSGTLLNGNTLTNVSLASPGAAKGAKVGTYPITASAAQGLGLTNYSITYSNGLLTVTPTNLTIAATSLSKTYGTSLALPGTSFTNTDMEPGDTVTNVALESGGTNAAAAAGLYVITSTNALGVGLTNYDIEYASNTLTVAQAVLTATADDRSRAYGQPNPAFTISFTGLVNGEGTNVLNSLPLASTTATTTTAPGTYPITLAGGLDDNYSFSLVAGTLSILPPGNISVTTVERLDADHFRLAGTGDANVNYQIQASTDLQSWQTLGTATADGAGAFEFVDALAGGFTARFYRVATP